MPSVTMGLLDAKLLASALVPHASKDDVTPALKQIALGGEHGQYAIATDRYTVGRYDLTNVVIGDLPTEVFLIPRDVLSAVRSLGGATLVRLHDEHNYRVVFETLEVGKIRYIQAKVIWHSEELGDMVHWMRTWDQPAISNFPPVARLFRQVKAGGGPAVLLGPEHVDKFTGYARAMGTKMLVTMTEGSGERRLAPLLVEIGPRFKGLIQPNILLHREGLGPDLIAENEALDKLAEAEASAMIDSDLANGVVAPGADNAEGEGS